MSAGHSATTAAEDMQRAIEQFAKLCGMTAEEAERTGQIARMMGLDGSGVRAMSDRGYIHSRRQARRERTMLMLFVSIWRGENVVLHLRADEDPKLWTGPLLQRGLSEQQLRDHLQVVRMGETEIEQVWP